MSQYLGVLKLANNIRLLMPLSVTISHCVVCSGSEAQPTRLHSEGDVFSGKNQTPYLGFGKLSSLFHLSKGYHRAYTRRAPALSCPLYRYLNV